MGEADFVVRTGSVALTGNVQAILPANPARLSVSFTTDNAFGTTYVATQQGSGNEYRAVLPSTGELHFFFKDWGPVPAGAWSVKSSAMGNNVYWLEVLVNGG